MHKQPIRPALIARLEARQRRRDMSDGRFLRKTQRILLRPDTAAKPRILRMNRLQLAHDRIKTEALGAFLDALSETARTTNFRRDNLRRDRINRRTILDRWRTKVQVAHLRVTRWGVRRDASANA
jgi:hypothetical protein